MNQRRVVITGLGAISPLGNTVAETWANALEGKSGVDRVTLVDPEPFTSQIAGEVKNFDPETLVPKKDLRRYDRFTLLALQAAQEAWDASGVADAGYDPSMMGAILGVGIGGLRTLEVNHEALVKDSPRKISPFLIPAMISNLAPGHLGIRFNLQGVNYTVTSACTSGTHAIGEAFRMVKDGLQDMVMTGGSEAAVSHLGLGGFGRMKALSTRNDDPKRASRPFDKDRDGFVIGEGAGVLIVEELEAAQKRGANILCEVVGYGFSCDAFHMTAPPAGGEGAISCMKMALRSAALNPEDVQYINAHGTSTPINDPAETNAIKKVFGGYANEGLVVSSTKSMTGHLLGAAGGLEGIFLAQSIADGKVPPTANLDNPDEGCDLDYVPKVGRDLKVNAAMSNSFGFGGTNSSVVFKKV